MFVITMKTETGHVSATGKDKDAGLAMAMEWETGRADNLDNAAEAAEEGHKLIAEVFWQ